jgi:hypothetical protein
MIGKIWKFTLFFLLCLIVALLFNLPIQQVLPHVKLPDTVRVSGIDGTIVSGSALEIVVDRFPLRDIEYRYMPSCIPLLKICYRIDYSQGRVQVAYDLLNGDTEVSGARIEYPVTELAQYASNLLVQPAGRLELYVDDLAIIAGKPSALSGKLVWRDLGINDDGIRFNVGDYELNFTGSQEGYDFKLNDLGADLDVDGEGKVSADGRYSVDIRIVAGEGLEPQVRSVLRAVAKTVSHNHYRVDQSGQLPTRLRNQIFP